MVKVLVKVESFEGSIVSGGEHISRCRLGDVIEVKDQTWEDMQAVMPAFFGFVTKVPDVVIPQIENVKTKAEAPVKKAPVKKAEKKTKRTK